MTYGVMTEVRRHFAVLNLEKQICKLRGQSQEIEGGLIKRAEWKTDTTYVANAFDLVFKSKIRLFDFQIDLS